MVGFVGYPFAWALGFGPFTFLTVAAVMAVHLVQRRDVAIPRGLGLWALFLGWVALSATGIDTPTRMIAFVWRFAQYVSMTIVFVYVVNLGPGLSARRGRWLLRWMFGIVVVGGYLGLLLPSLELPSLSLPLLPGAARSDEFVRGLLTPGFADLQTFLGYPLARPRAPFPYTNTWGAAFGLLFPWVLADVLERRDGRAARTSAMLLAAAVVPMVMSLNRAMWLSVAASLVFLVVRARGRRTRRAANIVVVVVPLLLGTLALTPLGGLVQQRFETPHSNNTREGLAEDTLVAVAASPLLGYGAPRPYEGPGIRPPLGTQGMLWFVMFSHGLPALALFLGFFVALWRRLRSSPWATWARMTLVALAVQLPFYDLFDVPLVLVATTTGLALHQSRSVSRHVGV